MRRQSCPGSRCAPGWLPACSPPSRAALLAACPVLPPLHKAAALGACRRTAPVLAPLPSLTALGLLRRATQVQAFAPEVLVIAGMAGGSALGPLTDLCAVASLPGWWLLPAVRASAVFVADAALLCRPGPRLVEGVECLARMLWDDAVPGCPCPDRALLKLSLRPGQRCRPRLLPNHFVPFTQ